MAHKKVEIQNILDASQARDNETRALRNKFQDIIEKVDSFNWFVNQACCCDDDGVVVTRAGFKAKLAAIETAIGEAKAAAAAAADQWVDFDSLWSSSITDTTGLTDAPEEEEVGTGAENPGPGEAGPAEAAPEEDPTGTDPESDPESTSE